MNTISKKTKDIPLTELKDRTPKYTVKEIAEKLGLTTYTVRYYDNAGLIPDVDRTSGNIRMFSEHHLAWLRVVHCLRTTGLSVDKVRHYIQMCLEGESTIAERAEIIFEQEKVLRRQLKELKEQQEVLLRKKKYYLELMEKHGIDRLNPKNIPVIEPDIGQGNQNNL